MNEFIFWVLTGSLLVFSGACYGVTQAILFHYSSIEAKFNLNPLFWDERVAWKNKYKPDLKTPRFFGSTTFLAFTTSGFHLFSTLWRTALVVIVYAALFDAGYGWWGVIIGETMRVVWAGGFHLTYSLILKA